MKPEEIGKAYDKITHLWQGDSFNYDNGIEAHKRAIKFVKNKNKALDVGCGCTGRIIDLLLDAGFETSGLDVSTKMLNLAKKRHPNVDFISADICEYSFRQQYDFITAWDSIWHIPLALQRQVMAKLVQGLNAGGVLMFSFGGVAEPGCHSNNAMGPTVYYSTLGVAGFLNLFIDLGCEIRHLEFDQYPDLHTYLIVEKV